MATSNVFLTDELDMYSKNMANRPGVFVLKFPPTYIRIYCVIAARCIYIKKAWI